MKKVIKVSIGNTAFTLEEDAYKIMNDYLNALSSHYKNKPSGQEVVDGIEERIAELLLERCGENKIITAPMAQQVTEILGKPEMIDEESGESGESASSSASTSANPGRKKLFRDPANRIFGGVCSGLGAYFDRDAALFRVIFILCALLFSVPSMGIGGGFFIILYIILWIILPSAKTVEQRCQMRGESNTIDTIEKNVKDGSKDVEDYMRDIRNNNPNFWKTFERVVSVIVGAVFTIVGISGVIACVMVFFGFTIWNAAFPAMAFDFLLMTVGNTATMTLLFKIFLTGTVFLPFIGFLYLGIQMMFGFKSPKWRPGLIIFLLWIVSLFCLTAASVSSSAGFWKPDEERVTNSISLQKDTLYIEFAGVKELSDSKIYVDADTDEYNLFYVTTDDKHVKEVTAYPSIDLRRGYEKPSVKLKSTIFPEALSFDEIREANKLDFYDFDGETLTVYPIKYNSEESVKEIGREIKICIDDDVTVIVKEPVYHEFNNSFEYSDMKWIKNKYIRNKYINGTIEWD